MLSSSVYHVASVYHHLQTSVDHHVLTRVDLGKSVSRQECIRTRVHQDVEQRLVCYLSSQASHLYTLEHCVKMRIMASCHSLPRLHDQSCLLSINESCLLSIDESCLLSTDESCLTSACQGCTILPKSSSASSTNFFWSSGRRARSFSPSIT